VARCRGVQEPPYQPTAVTEGIRTPADRSVSPGGFGHTGRVIAGAFAAAIAVGTALLSLPIATAGPGRADFLTALFHGTSAVCVTGLVTVDTGSHWSGFGQATILLLIQAGGLGIMTLATLFALLLSRRLGLRARLIAQAETRALSAADVRLVLRRAVIFSLASEAVAAVVLRQGWGDKRHARAGRRRRVQIRQPVTRAVLEACAAACKACGDECAQHAEMHEHCRVCAEACRRCETACRELISSLG
jgi:hypothetical protein